jgi:phosphatidate cytidylyltransferase
VSKSGNTMALPPRTLKFSRDWITRPVFALLLAGIVMAAIYFDKPYIEIVVAVAAMLAAREWHRMVGEGRFAVEFVATTCVIWLSLAVFLYWPVAIAPPLVLAAGALLVLGVGFARRNNPLWHAGGVVYLGIPSLAVLALRDFTHHGDWVLVGLFLTVWATDTGAFLIGNLVGGPKLAPVLSPNKTWSGFIGGTVSASAVLAIFIAVLGGAVLYAALFGAAIAVTAHAGDLFESMVKRRFHKKDSGSSIPGHGGVLDRIDSTLFAVVAFAIAVFAFRLDPLFGAFK